MSDPNIGTSATTDTPVRADATGSTRPKTYLEYDVTDEVIRDRDSAYFSVDTLRQLLPLIGGIIAVVTVVFTAFMLLFDVDNLTQKVDNIGDDVTAVEDVAKYNSNRLDDLNSSVSRIEHEVRDTKDSMNELRIDSARSRSREEEPPDSRQR